MTPLNEVTGTVYSNSYGKKNFSSSIAIEEKLSSKEIDQILDSYPLLIAEEYRGYYVNKLKALGKREFIKLADRAMKYGRDKQKMFADLTR